MEASTFNKIERKQLVVTGLTALTIVVLVFSYVTSLFAFVGPSSEHRWNTEIDSINAASFSPGDTVTITGLLDEKAQYLNPWQYYYYFASSDSVRWIITVTDPANTPVYIDNDAIISAQGDIIISPGSFNLPLGATTGTYVIRIIVWTDFLTAGETRTDTIYEGTFEVI